MEAGAVSAALLDERPTEVAEAAGLLSVTVQVVLALAASVAAAHCRVETDTGVINEIEIDADEPFNEAVTVAV